MSTKLKIVERYRDYAPPVDVYRSLRVLLRHVPEQYLTGLYKITLTNSESVRVSYRGKIWSEKRRVRPADCSGLYGKGHILLLIDQIFAQCPELFLLLPMIKTFVIGEVLYHEIGHHIHRIEEPGYRTNKEAVAEEWKEKLMRIFMTNRYWYLARLVKVYVVLIRPLLPNVTSHEEEEAELESDQGPA